MAEEESQALESAKSTNPRKRKSNSKMKNKPRKMPELKRPKIDRRMKKLFRKRARDYNSDEENDGDRKEDEEKAVDFSEKEEEEEEDGEPENLEARDANEEEENDFSGDEEDGEIQPGITKFAEGCRAFRLAFKSVHKKAVLCNDPLGPVMSGQKNLVAEKLDEDEAERNKKRQHKKEKHLIAEKGHVKLESFLGSHDKFLISVATKGVVKLFNAVNKAQHAQKGLNPSRSKDEKAIRKRRKEAFFSELKKTRSATATTVQASTSQADDGPAWAPLRDNYMLTSSKLKDWDKMPERAVADDIEAVLDDSSSDDD